MIKAVPKEGYALKAIAVTDQSGKPVAVTEKDGQFTFVMPACQCHAYAAYFEETACSKCELR